MTNVTIFKCQYILMPHWHVWQCSLAIMLLFIRTWTDRWSFHASRWIDWVDYVVERRINLPDSISTLLKNNVSTFISANAPLHLKNPSKRNRLFSIVWLLTPILVFYCFFELSCVSDFLQSFSNSLLSTYLLHFRIKIMHPNFVSKLGC